MGPGQWLRRKVGKIATITVSNIVAKLISQSARVPVCRMSLPLVKLYGGSQARHQESAVGSWPVAAECPGSLMCHVYQK